MSYAPINIPAYVAAYSGAIAGMAVSGWISSPTASNYANVTLVAGAFAQAFDVVWNSAAALNNLEKAAIQSIAQVEFEGRGPNNHTKFTLPSNWTVPAAACAALVLQSDAYFAGQGINPGTGGGGGGGFYQTVERNGVGATQELALNFSTAFSVTDNPGNGSTDIDIFVPFAVTAFTHAPALVLIGASVVNPGFTAAYNRLATTVQLTDTEGNSDAIALPGTAFVSPHTFTKTVYAQSVTFTDTANDGTGAAARTTGLTWGQNVYTGSIADPGVYNNAFVQALAATLKLGFAGTYAENAGAGASVFFCSRTAFGLTTANFTVGGFPFSCSKVGSAIPVTNNGVTENFDVFRSDNVALGAFNLVVA